MLLSLQAGTPPPVRGNGHFNAQQSTADRSIPVLTGPPFPPRTRLSRIVAHPRLLRGLRGRQPLPTPARRGEGHSPAAGQYIGSGAAFVAAFVLRGLP